MILLDTQALIWSVSNPKRLSRIAWQVIGEARANSTGLAAADSTLWEIAMAATRKKIILPGQLNEFLRYVERTFVIFPITSAIAEQSVQFTDRYPGDPHDRLIGATAVVHGFPLVTSDKRIRKSGEVSCVW